MSSIFKFWASTTSVTLGLVIVFQVAISCGEWFDIFLVKKGMTSASSFVCTKRNIRSQLVRGALQHEYIITRCCYRNNDVRCGKCHQYNAKVQYFIVHTDLFMIDSSALYIFVFTHFMGKRDMEMILLCIGEISKYPALNQVGP